MPMKPKVPCRHPGCAELVAPGQKYCENTRGCIQKEYSLLQREGMVHDGDERARSYYSSIHSARSVCGMALQCPRQLWSTSFRTEEIRSSSGTDRTGRQCVRGATTGRPEERITALSAYSFRKFLINVFVSF